MEFALLHPYMVFWMIVITVYFTADTIQTYAKRNKIKNQTVNIENVSSKANKAMAEFISGFDIDEKICKSKQFGDDCGAEGRNCIECIIKHFSE